MTTITAREFSRNIAMYLQRAGKGEQFCIKSNNNPIAHLLPCDKNNPKRWSMKKPTLKIKGLCLSERFSQYRQEERS